MKPQVHDIDIIVIPKIETIQDSTLFGDPQTKNTLDDKLAALCMDGHLQLESNGQKIKRFSHPIDPDKPQTISIDLYIASPETWWTLLLIRTGSREHNIRMARRALSLHMQLKADGSGLLTSGGSHMRIEAEQDIFYHLKLPYLEPQDREV